ALSHPSLCSSHAQTDRGRQSHAPAHGSHLNPANADQPRTESRGRNLVATGRGGAGNMSRSRVRDGSQPTESPAEVAAARSRSRSRARAHHHGEDYPVPTGRGGLGNVRGESQDARSREREMALEREDKEVEKRFAEKHRDDKWLSGRGGAGNTAHGEEGPQTHFK
ncbi:hypothetical protein DMC30DRAFT_346646, partial [Rhodotorula diobovata]